MVETPIGYPAPAARALQNLAKSYEKGLIKALRYWGRYRLRSSPLAIRGELAAVMAGPTRGEKPGARLLRSRRYHLGEHSKKVLADPPAWEAAPSGSDD